jgi:hypothetical protein
MKKILFASSLLAASGIAAAAGAAISATAVTGGASGACPVLTADASVKITLSSGNVGYYDCNTTTASIGVAVASTTGKNKVFSVGSAGGSVTTTTTSSAPTTTDCAGAATSASASS